MLHDRRSALARYIADLLSRGETVFTAEEAVTSLGIAHGAFLDAAARLQNRKALLSPRQGFYVAVPSQFGSWGAPPPDWYIDRLMQYEQEPYYVGLLKAAELHGATHQAVMEFQVITAKRLPKIRAGRNLIVFYYRKDLLGITVGLESRKTNTGKMQISSPALTALDLLRYSQASAGIDNVATVLSDLVDKIDAQELATLSRAFERPVVQRLGYLLDYLGFQETAKPMHEALIGRGTVSWTELDRKEIKDPDFAAEPIERNVHWQTIVRRLPEVDE